MLNQQTYLGGLKKSMKSPETSTGSSEAIYLEILTEHGAPNLGMHFHFSENMINLMSNSIPKLLGAYHIISCKILCYVKNHVKNKVVPKTSFFSWLINSSTMNHSYWSYKPNERYLGGTTLYIMLYHLGKL